MNTMNTTPTRTQLITAAVGAAIAAAAAPALLFLGAGTAQAIPDVRERGATAIIHDLQENQNEQLEGPALPTQRSCPSCVGFNPQPDPPGYPAPSTHLSPGLGVGDGESGYGGPDMLPSLHH